MYCHRRVGFFDAEMDEKYDLVPQFLQAFLIQDFHWAYVSLSKQSILFQKHIMIVDETTGVVYAHHFLTDRGFTWENALQLKDWLLALLLFSESRNDVLKQHYPIQYCFSVPHKHSQASGVIWIDPTQFTLPV